MLSGFSNIFKNINERRKICKSVTMAMQGSHHGALQNFPFFFTVIPVLLVCICVQSKFDILKLMFMKENLHLNMTVKFDKFLKTDRENIEILSSAGINSNDVNWRRCELPRSSFGYWFTHFRIM